MEYSALKNMFLGQTTLEICLVIILSVLLLMGIISSWNYFNKTKVERMDNYRATRLSALDLRSGTGKQINYTPSPLDIFQMSQTVGEAPPMEGAGGYPSGSCDELYANITAPINGLAEDIGNLTGTFAGLLGDSTGVRTDMGMLKVWYEYNIIGWEDTNSYILTWVYGTDDAELFFLNDWDTVGADFDHRYYDVLSSSSIMGIKFEKEPNQFYTRDGVWNNYITPGLEIEEQAAAVNLETLIKSGLMPLISKTAEAEFNACIRTVEGQDKTCDENCDDTLKQAESEIAASITEADSGQLDASKTSFGQAVDKLDEYEICYKDCSGEYPWYKSACEIECEDEFDAYMDKTMEAQTAAAEGRLGDAITLGEEAEGLYSAYEGCINGCS